jgi:hypothetical protein
MISQWTRALGHWRSANCSAIQVIPLPNRHSAEMGSWSISTRPAHMKRSTSRSLWLAAYSASAFGMAFSAEPKPGLMQM